MSRKDLAFLSIAIATHPNIPGISKEVAQIVEFLKARGLKVEHGLIYDEHLVNGLQQKKFDLWIALGGDGTMLRSGHLCAPHQVPILGINLGRLGFLIEVKSGEWREGFEKLLMGNYWLESRMMLLAEQYRKDQCLGRWDIINEAMVGRGKIMRPVHLKTFVDGRYLTTYVSDGLIAATPTGSTAYALAAGGPILPPELRNILIVPVAPHLSVDRAIVLSEGSFVSIHVQTDHKAALSIDGQPPVSLKNEDRVDVRANQHSVLFVRLQDPGYFYRNLTSRMNRNPAIGAL